MNWEVAKTWLIALFVVLDVILGWQLYSSHQVSSGYTESPADLLASTKTLLADHGLQLATQVPTTQPELAAFQADSEMPALGTLESVVFPHAKTVHIHKARGEVITNEGTLNTLQSSVIAVNYAPALPFSSKRGVLDVAYRGDEYTLDDVTSSKAHAVYLQSVNGLPVFDVQIVTSQTATALQNFTEVHIDHVVNTSTPKPVISALEALDSLANEVDKSEMASDNKILKVDLGYARKVAITNGSTLGNNAGYWFPVWRVVTEGQTYYVNAFTGEVEIAPGF